MTRPPLQGDRDVPLLTGRRRGCTLGGQGGRREKREERSDYHESPKGSRRLDPRTATVATGAIRAWMAAVHHAALAAQWQGIAEEEERKEATRWLEASDDKG